MKLCLKKRKGLLSAILLFSVVMAIVAFGTLRVGTSLYASNKYNSEQYTEIQSYRAACELAVYSYVNELCQYTSRRQTSNDWLSTSFNQELNMAIEAIMNKCGTKDDHGVVNPLIWQQHDIVSIVSHAEVTTPSILLGLTDSLTKANSLVSAPAFSLDILELPEPDYHNSNNFLDAYGNGVTELKPIEVHVDLKIKGEEIKDTLYISGFHLRSTVEELGSGQNKITFVTIQFEEDNGGVLIYRENS